MANVTGTAGKDFIHLGGSDADGLTPPAGYVDNPGATNGNDIVNAGAGDDIIYSGHGNDTVNGQTGADTVNFAIADLTSADTVNGGTDGTGDLSVDALTLTSAGTLAAAAFTNVSHFERLNLADGVNNITLSAAFISSSDVVGTRFHHLFTVNGGEGNDTIDAHLETGFQTDVTMFGNGGADTLIGGAEQDTIDGGTGADIMNGGAGNDTYYIDDPHDVIVESSALDFDKAFTTVSYTIAPGAHLDALSVADPNSTDAIDLTGNNFADELTGNAGSNVLTGNGGRDFLDGGAGADTLIGGTGDDVYFVDDPGDQVIEAPGSGNDEVHTTVDFTVAAGVEIEQLYAEAPGIHVNGNELAQQMFASGADNVVLYGGGGDDTLDGEGNPNVVLIGGAGDDTFKVNGPSGTLIEAGGEGNDRVVT